MTRTEQGSNLYIVKKVILAGLTLILAAAGTVYADGMVIPYPGRIINETGQRAVIWHEGKRETLVISTKFKGDPEEFAWIIPVPSMPQVSAGKDVLFTALEDLTRPAGRDVYPAPLGLGMGSISSDSVNRSVTVWSTAVVDIYDTAVLSATDVKALREWLESNGYEYPATREHLLKSYTDKNWYFVAAKVKAEALGYAGTSLREGHATPLVISFDSEQPIYPLKISGAAATWAIGQKIAGFSWEDGSTQQWSWSRSAAGQSGAEMLPVPGAVQLSVTNNEAFHGKRSLLVSPSINEFRLIRTIYNLQANRDYTLSLYIKAAGSGRITLGGAGTIGEEESAGTEWKRVSMVFRSKTNNAQVEINGSGFPGESVYIDALQVEGGKEVSEFKDEVESKYTPSNVSSSQSMELYIFADHKKSYPGFATDYAGYGTAKNIEKLAVGDDGKPWIDAKKKMYLTNLSRTMTAAQMTEDLVLSDAPDNKTVGGAGAWAGDGVRVWMVLLIPLAVEVYAVYWYIKKRRTQWKG
ncbi:hypothetical protein A2395_02805 [Candidatus Amesbacteria bacterium RIFOXYB1_FULL_47_9]|uniref:Uncharacterized protein n=1 Tax=Candidatus Amesbacteria bacterium RIFOXYB1_FULL_47_9 TaxID=1797266 RepID=A0A1F4ZR74_9BACT|nr:MAG: hypothetical protein A2395_02805 [Candidatus Amesbacteria bacterium RIFOXYB1_FULL_47_9]